MQGRRTRMGTHFAYAFKTRISLLQIFDRLNQLGPWRWRDRETDRWDAYISTVPMYKSALEMAMVKIFADEGFYVVDIQLSTNDPKPKVKYWDVLYTLFREL